MAKYIYIALLLTFATLSLAHDGPHRDDDVMDSPYRTRQQLMCRRQLRFARKQLKCALLRLSLPRRMDRARDCLYNGLPYSEYAETREICRERSESLTRLRAAKAKCREAGITVRWFMDRDDDVEEEEEEEEEPVDVSGIECDDYERLLRERLEAVAACIKIGWDGSGDRDNCPNLGRMKHILAYIKETGCGEDGVSAWRRIVSIKERRCGRPAGTVAPLPSNPPRH